MSFARPRHFPIILVFGVVAGPASAADLIVTNTADAKLLHVVHAAWRLLHSVSASLVPYPLLILPGSNCGIAIV